MGLEVTGDMPLIRGAIFLSSGLLTPVLGRESYLLFSSDNFYFLKRGFGELKGGFHGYSQGD